MLIFTPPLDGDQILAAQALVISITIWVLLAVSYLKGEMDRVMCRNHSMTIGEMWHAGHITAADATSQIFSAIHDDKF